MHADLLAAADEASRLASVGDSAGAAIIVTPCDPDQPPAPLLQRAAALAAVANPGAVVCDEATAMALVRAGWDGTVEELGELPLPSGREPIWSLLPA
jgi:hypothetical protein